MKISKIILKNFRSAKDIEIELHDKINLFVGVNGAGKSTILQAINYSLIALVKRIHNVKTIKNLIKVSDIHNSADQLSISIEITYRNEQFKWRIEQTRPGGISKVDDDLNELINLTKILKQNFKQKESLPVLIYYPVSRVTDKKLIPKYRYLNNDNQLDIYDDALEGKPNFHNFFRWFKDQDDFVNQKLLSRSQWISKNRFEIRRHALSIIDSFERFFKSQNLKSVASEKDKKIELELLLSEPRFFFREIIQMIQFSGINDKISTLLDDLFHELDFVQHKLDMLSYEGRNLFEESKSNVIDLLKVILTKVSNLELDNLKDRKLLNIVWQMVVFSLEIGLWWLNDKNHLRLRRELNNISWFDSDTVNVKFETNDFNYEFLETVEDIIENDIQRRSSASNSYGKDLNNISRAILGFIPDYANLRVERKKYGSASLFLDKNGEEFNLDQLSDGEKNFIAIIGDIARRLTIGNPNSSDPLNETGIVIIDEIDLHLHPKWQRIVAENLTKVFPNCQFILSTHSPQVISHIKPESLFLVENIRSNIKIHSVNDSYGKSSNSILEDIMEETSRPKNIDQNIKDVFRYIQEGKIDDANKLIFDLRSKIGEDSELVKADVLIKRRGIIGK
ncbi:MAG: AAA family ATPase [Leptospiraceae bacterium]|nr:AAA family ATPase [Leptospiraceae bacterium]